jgi:hypothetical protein
MAVSVKTGSFSSGTGAVSSTVVVSGVGFKPNCVIFWWSNRTVTTDTQSTATEATIGVGWMLNDNSDGAPTARRAAVGGSADAATSGDTWSRMQNDACVVAMAAGAVIGILDGSVFGSDGFTLIVDDAFPASVRIHYMALAGADLTNFASGRSVLPTATGTVDYTGPGFQPDFVLCVGCRGTSENADQTHHVFTVGAGISTTKRGTIAGVSLDGNTTMFADGYGLSTEMMAFGTPAAASPQVIEARADFSAFLSNGFQLNWTEVPGVATCQFMWLAIKGGQWDVYEALTQTDTTTDITATHGFQPRGGMVLSAQRAESTADANTAHLALSVGAYDSDTSERCAFILDTDNVGTSLCAQGQEHDSVYGSFVTATQALDGIMHVNSIGATATVFRMSDADASQRWFFGWAVGDNAAVGGDVYTGRGIGRGISRGILSN